MTNDVASVRSMLESGRSLDECVSFLSERAHSRIETISILREITGLPIGDLKTAIHMSPAWEPTREADIKLHDDLLDGLDDAGESR